MSFNFHIAGITPRDFEWINGAFNFSENLFARIEAPTTEAISIQASDGQTLLDSDGNKLFVRR